MLIQRDTGLLRGYNQEQEDRLLAQSGWTEDGYRLFDVSVFAASSRMAGSSPSPTATPIFMRRTLWDELGGFKERFQTPGGGLVNSGHARACRSIARAVVVTLQGEGTFHQVHGGVATNSIHNMAGMFQAEYK